jgi:hypothetical protein
VEWSGKRIWIPSDPQVERCHQLIRMAGLGMITNLRFEVPIKLVVKGVHICTYRMDAIYTVPDARHGGERTVHEEVKGMPTPEYILKRKLHDALAPVPVSVIDTNHKSAPEFNEDGTRKRDEKGRAMRSVAAWVRVNWADRIPD